MSKEWSLKRKLTSQKSYRRATAQGTGVFIRKISLDWKQNKSEWSRAENCPEFALGWFQFSLTLPVGKEHSVPLPEWNLCASGMSTRTRGDGISLVSLVVTSAYNNSSTFGKLLNPKGYKFSLTLEVAGQSGYGAGLVVCWAQFLQLSNHWICCCSP